MIPKALLFALLALEPVCLLAADTPAPLNSLEVAGRQSDLFNHSDRPFVMDVDFTVQVDPAPSAPVQGHLRLRWEASDRWWSRVSLGKFEQVKFQKGGWSYRLGNVDFTPKQIKDLFDLLHVGKGFDKFVTQEAKQRSEAGVHLDCQDALDPVREPDKKFKPAHFELCIDSSTHDIVTETRRASGYMSDDLSQKRFSDFVDFGGLRYPRKFEFLKDGHTFMSASVTALQQSPLDPKLLVPPAGAIERRECPDKKDAEVLYAPESDPDHKLITRRETDVQVTLLADGSISNIQIVATAGREHDDLVIEAVKKWKFAPAMCGTEPVASDFYVTWVTRTYSH